VTISDIPVTRGGQFAILANGVINMTVTRANILNAKARDGFNLINSQGVSQSCFAIFETDGQAQGA
jgi:hypothetical protein